MIALPFSDLFARSHTSPANFSEFISKNLEVCELYAVAICESFCIVTDRLNPYPVCLSSIETSFELISNVFSLLALKLAPVTSHSLALACAIVFFRNSVVSSKFKSSNFLS